MSYEPLLTLVAALFTGGVLGYLWCVVRSGARKRGNLDLAAKAKREAPYDRLLGLGLGETRHLKKSPENARRLQDSITQLDADSGAARGERKGLVNLLQSWEPLPDDDDDRN